MEAKRNILRFQGASDVLVLNMDDEATRSFADTAAGEVRYFSRRRRVSNGVFLDGETIYEAAGGKTEFVMNTSQILLPGIHNVENFMAAIAAVRGLVGRDACAVVARTFAGVAHRIELVRTLRGVRYYNDSIASSPTRTIAGLHAFDRKVILIAGGKDKGIPYGDIGPEIVEHVKTLVLTGPTGAKIKSAVMNAAGFKGSPEIIEKEDFREAVLAAHAAAEDGDIVLMSPASTSFDRFKNFEERGNTFKEIVLGLE